MSYIPCAQNSSPSHGSTFIREFATTEKQFCFLKKIKIKHYCSFVGRIISVTRPDQSDVNVHMDPQSNVFDQ